ncbi:MAG: hypothetical protein ACLQIQ_19760 [Beijerinckiaceae bacterium]
MAILPPQRKEALERSRSRLAAKRGHLPRTMPGDGPEPISD